MKTLEELVIESKSRKGVADGTTKNGAFWIAGRAVIRSYGGDGIGQSSTHWKHHLHLRHYRNGEVKAVVHICGYHQNNGDTDIYRTVNILHCETVEDVITVLKGVTHQRNDMDDGVAIYSNWGEDVLTGMLTGLGLLDCLTAPDEG